MASSSDTDTLGAFGLAPAFPDFFAISKRTEVKLVGFGGFVGCLCKGRASQDNLPAIVTCARTCSAEIHSAPANVLAHHSCSRELLKFISKQLL